MPRHPTHDEVILMCRGLWQTTDELMATSEYVDPRVNLAEAKQMMSFMDTNRDGQARAPATHRFAPGGPLLSSAEDHTRSRGKSSELR